MTAAEILEYVKNGGGICAPMLFVALWWMNDERKEALAKCDAKDEKLESLSERTITVLTELKGLLSHKGGR